MARRLTAALFVGIFSFGTAAYAATPDASFPPFAIGAGCIGSAASNQIEILEFVHLSATGFDPGTGSVLFINDQAVHTALTDATGTIGYNFSSTTATTLEFWAQGTVGGQTCLTFPVTVEIIEPATIGVGGVVVPLVTTTTLVVSGANVSGDLNVTPPDAPATTSPPATQPTSTVASTSSSTVTQSQGTVTSTTQDDMSDSTDPGTTVTTDAASTTSVPVSTADESVATGPQETAGASGITMLIVGLGAALGGVIAGWSWERRRTR